MRIAEKAEESINYIKRFNSRDNSDVAFDVTNAISHATCTTAHDLGAKAIVTVTKSGVTARQLSKFRPFYPIVGCTTQDHVWRQLNLSWGVVPMLIDEVEDTDALFERAVAAAEQTGLVKSGDLVVITAGVPLGVSGTTNMMKVHMVGHVLLTGEGVTEKPSPPGCACASAWRTSPKSSGTGTSWWSPRPTTALWNTCTAARASSPSRRAPTPTPPSRAWPWTSR